MHGQPFASAYFFGSAPFEQNVTYTFENHPNSPAFEVIDVDQHNSLSEALSRFNKCSNDNQMETLVRSLAGQSNLTKISFSGNIVGRMAPTALRGLLSNSSIVDLNIYNSLNNESALRLANALAGNDVLRKLNIGGNPSVAASGWNAIITHLPLSLEELDVSDDSMDDTVGIFWQVLWPVAPI